MKRILIFFAYAVIVTYQAAIEADLDEDMSKILLEMQLLEPSNYSVEYLVKSHGYPIETHKITTSDGYILTIHRIPYGRNRKSNGKVAFLQHGLLSSSADWVLMGPTKALAYLLADQGYDVWMGNARGNVMSRAHTSYNPDKDSRFWKFSWHEIGTLDLPAMIDYVLGVTAVDGIYYAGHSQGTTTFYVMATELPQYNAKIKVQTSLAPIAFMNHMTSPLIRVMARWRSPIEALLKIIGYHEFLPNNDFIRYVMGDAICKVDSVSQLLCRNALFALCGFSRTQMNTTLLPLMLKYTPAGSSTQQLLHYGQEVISAKFRQYDYGRTRNIKHYRSLSPPDYDLKKVTAPVYLIYSKNDWLAAQKDVRRLCTGMKSACKETILISDLSFNHLDFMYGIDAPSLVYNKVLSLFARY